MLEALRVDFRLLLVSNYNKCNAYTTLYITSNKAVTVLEQCVVSYLKIFMYFISYKCMVGEVGSYYCQLAVAFFFLFFLVSLYQTRDNVVPQFIFDPPFP